MDIYTLSKTFISIGASANELSCENLWDERTRIKEYALILYFRSIQMID